MDRVKVSDGKVYYLEAWEGGTVVGGKWYRTKRHARREMRQQLREQTKARRVQ